ncbi:pre-mRNA-splicing factor rse1 [Yamadazyma tenuis]|uniref:DNA damage-binding protein 1 n=1 Tax=Candida tenuis (strain ATCC 10573 / BCRC 21748 / CBS 615 / JCM 9827 / NBRC 10315 / NRRL Y-1498 / VKM Y-70) TaxID=590646 RepID=G3B572_CANTC|nr:uncharacterized protein CANTEDRAFT_134986 [Yamadazyma tenuis ATCC 10573]XP_006687501.1 uncharacterized protein CANTEDRAFT_134986 [Yamadazyma tenuis ATCC 10573]EGV63707.1 hypothetical protein CANTEDRAFT_134986 [Yamadazyma tenuis ATCC 10573]EGV63708.1 hypothetical protein CANTEDRAFT_134986 [Yamadazyma tenuis ATCC 10573]WEJ97028.1 pre-mRNA-splicing factor rse1 [Yamadazyma tenuis]
MYLYNFTSKASTSSVSSIIGQFTKKQQLVIATANTLETWIQQDEKIEKVRSQFSFGIIQKLEKLRPLGFDRDLLVITSDSGNLTVCEFKHEEFVPLFHEPHSKNGLRSITPGEYLDIDPHNRAIMISAVERNKLLYRVHVENERVSLSSPLECLSNNTFTLCTCAVDNGFNNPLFAAIEIDSNKKTVLNYYELDQGLNHVMKRTEDVPESANLLIPFDGLMVCCDGFILHNGKELAFPKKSKIVNYVIHKLKNDFFVLLQNEFGDLFKVDTDQINYFGHLPVSVAINIFKNGHLYANCSNTNKLYCQITGLKVSRSTSDNLENLELVQTIESLDPILDIKLKDSHLITANSTSVKTLVHGVPTTTIVESPLPSSPLKIFTTKLTRDDVNDAYLVISSSETSVLSIGEEVAEVTDSKFSKDPTILVQQVGKMALIQVYSNGIKHINGEKVTDWFPPAGINIIKASSNNQQLIIGLTNNEVIYFEVDVDDQLVEYQDKVELPTNITALAISKDFAVAGCADETVQVISLKQQNCLEILSMQMLSSNSSAIEFSEQEVHIGMENGLFVRTNIDARGKLSNTRVKYLGTKPIRLSKINDSILAISSKPWVGFKTNGNFNIVPLNDIDITDGTSFYSEDIGGEGIVGFRGNDLIIFTIDDFRNNFIISTEDIPATKLLVDNEVYSLGKELVRNNKEKFAFEESPLSICRFKDYVVVGVTNPNFLYTFKDMKLVHKTEVEMPPRSILEFNGRLLVGMDNLLRTYDLGKKQLLRKSSTAIKHINKIIRIVYQGKDRIVVGDSNNSTIFCKFIENSFVPISDDTMNRQITSLSTLDYDTVIGGDKFGNVFVNRIKYDNTYFVEESYLNGSSGRCQTLAEFFLNDIPMSFTKGTLVLGGPEVIIYAGLQGTIGILLPISESDFKFLSNLSIELNKDLLLGRDHMKFRGYYNSTHNVIDGDIIEKFLELNASSRIKISNKLNKSVREIENKINDYREKSAF